MLPVTSEQLAIVVPSVTAVLILAGNLWYQWRPTQRTLQHEAAVAETRLNHERTIARDERVQDRIAAVYDELLLYLSVRMDELSEADLDAEVLNAGRLPEVDRGPAGSYADNGARKPRSVGSTGPLS